MEMVIKMGGGGGGVVYNIWYIRGSINSKG